MRLVLLFGAAWVAILGLLLLVVGGSLQPRVETSEQVTLTPPPPPPFAGQRFPGWTVTRAYSAHHTMVVEVETDTVTNARQIALQVVEPLKGRYDEVLIYVRRPGRPYDELAARRVQWTKRGGYIESIYDTR